MSWFFLWLERRRSRSPPEGDQGNDDPLGQCREAGTYQRKLRHRVGICPASMDLGIEPLAEDRVGKAAERSAERRVGKECISTRRSRRPAYHQLKKSR